MSSHYRERREAGVYSADEEEREKAGAKFDKNWNRLQEQAQQEEEESQAGTASP
jgi:hypothetical protein